MDGFKQKNDTNAPAPWNTAEKRQQSGSSASTGASPAATEEQGRAQAQASTPSGMQTPSSFSSMPETSVVGGIQVTNVGVPRFQTEETVLGSQELNA